MLGIIRHYIDIVLVCKKLITSADQVCFNILVLNSKQKIDT